MRTKLFPRLPTQLATALWLIAISAAPAQTGVPLWTNRYNGPANGEDHASAIAVDATGDVVVTGSSYDGPGVNKAYATIKYSAAGVPVWTNRYHGQQNGDNFAHAVAIDVSGNVLVTGMSLGSDFRHDYVTIKYSGAGVPLWTNRYTGPENSDDEANALAVDPLGNVFVTGSSGQVGASLRYDFLTVAYSGAGEPLWTNRYDGPGDGDGQDVALALVVDGSGNVIVTGTAEVIFGVYDYATIKYSSTGEPLWTNRYNGPGNQSDYPVALAVDGNDNVIVTGFSYASDTDFDYATIKYSAAGLPLWTNRYDGSGSGTDQATALTVENDGDVFVTGWSWNGSSYEYATIKYSGAGEPLWTNRYNGPGNSGAVASAVAVDNTGNVFVTGYSDSGYATVGYSSTGLPLWTNRYHGQQNGGNSASAVATDVSGNVLVTGQSSGDGIGYDYATIKYSAAVLQSIPLNYQIVGNQLVLSWTNAAFSLQSAPNATGAYTNILGAVSPYTNSLSGTQQYFRLKAN